MDALPVFLIYSAGLAFSLDQSDVAKQLLARRRFVVGVHWHPESFWDHGGAFQPLFEAVVRAGRRE